MAPRRHPPASGPYSNTNGAARATALMDAAVKELEANLLVSQRIHIAPEHTPCIAALTSYASAESWSAVDRLQISILHAVSLTFSNDVNSTHAPRACGCMSQECRRLGASIVSPDGIHMLSASTCGRHPTHNVAVNCAHACRHKCCACTQ